MHSIVKTWGLIVAVLFMSACTTTRAYNHIDPEARALIKSMDSVLISKQRELKADINVSKLSSYVQGHFVPVLIDIGLNSYRNYKANQIMAPMLDTMADHDYTEELNAQLSQALAESGFEGSDDLKIIRQEPQGFRAAYIRQSDADAVMFIDATYAFTPKFDALNVTSRVMVFPVNPALSPYKEKPDQDNIIEVEDNIYRNQFRAIIPVGIEDGSKTENGEIWGQMSEEELAGKMEIAAKKLALTISQDLSVDDGADILEDDTPPEEPESGEIGEETEDGRPVEASLEVTPNVIKNPNLSPIDTDV